MGVTATRLVPADKTVEMDTGESPKYDKLLLATGGRVRTLNIPGTDLQGVYYLRTLRDSQRLAQAINISKKAGGGRRWVHRLGSRCPCRMKGLEVTLLETEPVPLRHALGDELGTIYADIHRSHGIELRLQEGINEIQGNKNAERVVTTSGSSIPCDLVAIGVGIAPETGLVEDTEIEVDNGVLVDEFCRTNLPDIYAAGDVANWWHPDLGYRLRVEHWDNSLNQGAAAARNMLGRREPYSPVLYFWSDQYDLNLQYVGHATQWDDIVYRGDPKEQRFTAFFMQDNMVLAALAVNRFKDVNPARNIIKQRLKVDAKTVDR